MKKSAAQKWYRPRYRNRTAQVRPILKKYQLSSVLYVGASWRRQQFVGSLAKAAKYVDVLEAWPDNVKALHTNVNFRNVIQGDVRDIDKLIRQSYDLVFWWHGPEHVTEEEASSVIDSLREIAKVVILGCPWGILRQDAAYDNPYEQHQSALYPSFFEERGFLVSTMGQQDKGGSNITAWLETDWRD